MYSQEDDIVIAMRPSGMDFSISQIVAEVTQVRLTMAEHEPRKNIQQSECWKIG